MTTRFTGRGPLSDWHGHLDAELGSLVKIRGNVDISGQGQSYRASMQLEARQDGLVPPDMAPFIGDRAALTAVVDYDGKAVVTLEKLNLSLAVGDVSGSGRLDSTTQRIDGQLHLTLPDLHPAQVLLGETLAGQQKYADAEPLLLRGYEGMKAGEASHHVADLRIRDAGERVVRFYEATGQPEKAREWRAKLPPPVRQK